MRLAFVGVIVSLGVFSAGFTGSADEEKIPLKDVPKIVIDAVSKRFPKGEAKAAEKVVEKGVTSYEVSLKDQGKAIDVVVTDAGKISAIETMLSAAELPKPVAMAVSTKYPKGSIKSAEEIVEIDGARESKNYEVIVSVPDKKAVELKISPDGKILGEEDAEDD